MNSQEISPKEEKLIQRFKIMSELNSSLDKKSHLCVQDLVNIKRAFVKCSTTQPSWSEKSYWERAADILSLGMTIVYKAFSSREASHVKKSQEISELEQKKEFKI